MPSTSPFNLRVAIIGAGPAGIYAGNILSKAVQDAGGSVAIDLFDKLPAPYGLIRYGVAPDHPRIKGIVTSLHEMLDSGSIRFIGNVTYGVDVSLQDLREQYHAVIFATGAIADAPLTVPGIDLPGSYGAADFVSWYDGHPDVARSWPLDATDIAVIGNGNVALDVARMLAKHPKDLLSTDIPDNVHAGLDSSPVTDVHIFGRRGPSQVKFTPIELRELAQVPDVDVIVYEEDFVFDEHTRALATTNNQVKVMTRTLEGWLTRQPTGASRRLHLHFLQAPLEIYGNGRVEGIRFERTEPSGDGGVRGTGVIVDYPVQAVYRAVGYRGSALPDLPFDEAKGVIPNDGGRVLNAHGTPIAGIYATGWIKRGPVGLIGHTKGDALETITRLMEDATTLEQPAGWAAGDGDEILRVLTERGVHVTTWPGWLILDAHEKALGTSHAAVRDRVKVVERDEQVHIARADAAVLS
ncbi:FAD-dependent oxidoreductase [Cryobacterium psychrophilum]|uniref:ferredoxin--NADP(+) reductase n=1 Tax=Cryobacterium psychrophilum TaxID=41988 RepID=A0A4Y8KQ19_9MICO|nr:FAD-dependent oxidoreductase [Cryobacterium psychrophilum]TDW31201.1 ferredoxin--NADP+ reductase [Cryobacterium psychrophilum]TFD78506.1 pyridine nucleotide-disulfide oxidoreductase [Cryobacterium psychrophilum]